jgi:hypothetical protein
MKKILLFLMSAFVIAGCEKKEDQDNPEMIVISGSGDISPKVNEFRDLLGDVLNTTPGQISGRREINWDAVPDQYSSERIPADFFNPTAPGSPASLQRGFQYSGDVDGRISANLFADQEASNAEEFSSFSGGKTFSAVSSNLWNVDFEVPGQAKAASVNGFGAVFSDVDIATSATIEYFSGNRSLGIFKVPVRAAGSSHSFLGVYFPAEKITRVRIRQGDAVVANGAKDISAGGSKDLVIMDDFLYNEPKAIQ